MMYVDNLRCDRIDMVPIFVWPNIPSFSENAAPGGSPQWPFQEALHLFAPHLVAVTSTVAGPPNVWKICDSSWVLTLLQYLL